MKPLPITWAGKITIIHSHSLVIDRTFIVSKHGRYQSISIATILDGQFNHLLGETFNIANNLFLAVLLAFVAYGRGVLKPISDRIAQTAE